jgi:hypothetical protein
MPCECFLSTTPFRMATPLHTILLPSQLILTCFAKLRAWVDRLQASAVEMQPFLDVHEAVGMALSSASTGTHALFWASYPRGAPVSNQSIIPLLGSDEWC